MRKLCTDEVVRVQNEEKLKKKLVLQFKKNVLFLNITLIWLLLFGFAFQR
jgi:hypothetical protein